VFKGGKREGHGTFYYATGARYTGDWAANAKHGEGAFMFEDGTVYEGSFAVDRCVTPVRWRDAAGPSGFLNLNVCFLCCVCFLC